MEYSFKNIKTGKIVRHELKISEYDEFKKNHPELERYHESAPSLSYLGTGDLDGKKTDNTWKEVLQKVAEQNPRSPLADKVRRKSIKEIKTNQILEKHIKKQQGRR